LAEIPLAASAPRPLTCGRACDGRARARADGEEFSVPWATARARQKSGEFPKRNSVSGLLLSDCPEAQEEEDEEEEKEEAQEEKEEEEDG